MMNWTIYYSIGFGLAGLRAIIEATIELRRGPKYAFNTLCLFYVVLGLLNLDYSNMELP